MLKTIGQIIKTARTEKRLSLRDLEDITKIKTGFIDSIEKENWQTLPSFTVVLGFVKSLSSTLGINEKTTVAILKRDYPPKKLNINPKPDVHSKFSWSPKLTFAVGIAVVILAILSYIIFQYIRFISPPNVSVESPAEGQVISGNSVAVFGSTDQDAKITVNDQPVLVDQDGNFSTGVGVTSSTNQVIVKAISRSGKERTITRKITVQ